MKQLALPLVLTINGYLVKPELSRHLTAKRAGHALSLRVRKDGKDVAYLDTDLYVMPAAFDAKLKQLKDPIWNNELVGMVARAGKMLGALRSSGDLKAAWAGEKLKMERESFEGIMDCMQEEVTLVSLYKKREALAAELKVVRAAIEAKEQELGVKPLPTITHVAVEEYETVRDEFMLTLAGRNKRDISAFRYCFTSIEEYGKHKSIPIGLMSFDYQFYLGYANFMMYHYDNYNNAFGAKIKKLKQFLKYCESNGYAVNKGYKEARFKILEEEKKVVYLDDVELDLIWKYKSVVPAYTETVDLVLFQALTGLRVSDTLRKHHIESKKGKRFLTGLCKKNHGTFLVPLSLDPRIEEILEDHSYQMTFMTEAAYNSEMKRLVEEVYEYNGLEMPIIHYTRFKLSDKIELSKKKCLLISSHSMRRSFCTRHLNGGHFNETDVLEMLGSTDLKELQKYIEVESSALDNKAERSAKALTKMRKKMAQA